MKKRIFVLGFVFLIWSSQFVSRYLDKESVEKLFQNIPKIAPAIGLIILSFIFWFVRKNYEKRKFLLEYGFVANAKILSITNSMIRVNNVQLKNVRIEFNGTKHTLKNENPETFKNKKIDDTIRIRYNSQNTAEFMIDPEQ
jgi:hypothetical protein